MRNSQDSVNLEDEEKDQVHETLPNKTPNNNVRAEHNRKQSAAEINLNILQNAIIQKAKHDNKGKKHLKPNFQVHGKKFRFANRSLFIFHSSNCFRKAVVWLQEWKWFENFIILAIICNTIILMFQDYRYRLDDKYNDNWRNNMIEISEIVFAFIFIFEFLVKIIGMGFITEQGTYLRDGWNILDFLVVITSVLSFFPKTPISNFSAIRTLRMLRPLRSINSVKGMKVLVTTLIDSIPALGNVVVFLMFIMILFAILSLQLFSGLFENRCRMTEKPVNGVWEADPTIQRLCFLNDKDSCPEGRYCGSPYEEGLEFDEKELQTADFNYGYTRFDTLPFALFSIFQSLTTEGWTNIVFFLVDAYTPIIVYLYFIFLVLIGSFFVVNLILAVVNESFVSNEQKMKKKDKEEKENKEKNIETEHNDTVEDDNKARVHISNVNDIQNNHEGLSRHSSQPSNASEIQNKSKVVPVLGNNNTDNNQLASPNSNYRGENSSNRPQSQQRKVQKSGSKDIQLQKLDIKIDQDDEIQKKDKQQQDSQRNGQKSGLGTILAYTANGINEQQQNQDEIDKLNSENKNNQNNQEEQEEIDPCEGLTGITYLRKKVEIFIDEPFFIALTTLFIIANTLTLSLDKYPMDSDYESSLETCNIVFTIVFALEMAIKIFGLGPRGYVRDSFNIFDGVIVILSLIELILSINNSDVSGGGFAAISAFRSLRLFRIFKLARSWVNLRNLLLAMWQTLQQISNFSVLVLLFMTVSSLLGMEFFAYKIRFDEDDNVVSDLKEGQSPRVNYDEFLNGIVAVFVLLTNEDWNTVLYQHMRGIGTWLPVLYFVIVVVIGNFILLQLFLAILIYNFGDARQETQERLRQEAEEKKKAKKYKKKKTAFDRFTDKIKSFTSRTKSQDLNKVQDNGRDTGRGLNDEEDVQSSMRQVNGQVSIQNKSQVLQKQASKFSQGIRPTSPTNSKQNSVIGKKNADQQNGEQTPTKNNQQDKQQFSENGNDKPKPIGEDLDYKEQGGQSLFVRQDFVQSQKMARDLSKFKSDNTNLDQSNADMTKNITERPPLEGRSLFILGTKNFFRSGMYWVCGQNWFEWSVIGLILFSSVILVLDDPQDDPNSSFKQILYYIDFVVTILFVIESLIKIISFGLLFNGPHSFLRSLSNCLDFLIVIFSVIGLFNSSSGSLDKLKILRILRVLRPLRLISRNEGLKLAINSLILSIPSMFNLLLVCLIFFLLFGIFGVNYFKGTFFYCDIDMPQEKINDKIDCLDYGGNWVNKSFNFDNIIESMVTLFVLSTTEGWVGMMWDGVDSRAINLNPQRDAQPLWQLFYILFIVIGGFFIMNLFAGIVVDSFNTEKDKLAGMTLLSDEQQEWIDIQQRILDLNPIVKIQRDENNKEEQLSSYRQILYNFVTNKYFDPFILICIIVNTIVFMLVWHRQPEQMITIIQIINYVFLVIFTLEAGLKIGAFGKLYFSDPWNVFDFIVVCLTLVGVILEFADVVQNIGSATSIIRTFRIARVLKLIKRAKSLRMMFATFILTLPALANIGGLLFLVLFLYSVLGMNLYSFIWQQTEGLSDKANFVGFFQSFFTLFKCSTGENWNFILADIVKKKSPNHPCNDVNDYESFQKYGLTGCGDDTGYFFLISFQIIFAMIVLNLFVAVILEGFDKTLKNEESHLKPLDISDFIELWKEYDPSASGFIRCRDFRTFMEKLEPPLGFKNVRELTNQQKNIRIAHLHIPIYQQKQANQQESIKLAYYYFYDVFECLVKATMLLEYGILDLMTDLEKPVLAAQKVEKTRLKYHKKILKTHVKLEYNSADRVGVDYIMRQLHKYKIRKGVQQQAQQKQNKKKSSRQGSKSDLRQSKTFAENENVLNSVQNLKSGGGSRNQSAKSSFRISHNQSAQTPKNSKMNKSQLTKTRV